VGKFLRTIGNAVLSRLKWAKSNPALVGVVCVAIVLALVISGVIPIQERSASAHGRKPYEYLYLDPARVATYLGQLDDGEINQETRTNTIKSATGAKLEVNSLGELNGSLSNERTASAVVSFSEADNFFKLENILHSEGALDRIALNSCCRASVREELAASVSRLSAQRSGASPAQLEQRSREQLEARSEGELEHLTLGTIVKLEGAFLHVPPYMAAYPSLRYASFREDPNSRVLGSARSSQLSETEVTTGRHVSNERKRFIKDAGPNPRVPFAVELHGLTVVIPARFDYLTGDPSLLATDVTVVGKVVFTGKDYGDAASEATYLPPLLNAKRDFLADLGFKKAFLKKYPPPRRPALDKKLFQALQHSLIFKGASIEIIPIAIYS
jgi:hypothetical protein